MRITTLISTELRQTRANVAFMGLSVIAPVAFMALFVFLLSGDITSPVGVHPGPGESHFVQVMQSNRAPGNVPYFEVRETRAEPPTGEQPNLVVIVDEPASTDGQVTGAITHWFNDVNTNMTKNYRNRVTASVYAWSADRLNGSNIVVREYPVHADDISWSRALGVSVFGMGVLFTGLLFGLLSMTQEFQDGTMLWLRLAPRPPVLVVGAKLIACLLKSAIAGLILVGALWAFTGVLPARPLVLAGALTMGYLSAAAVGLLVGFISRNTMTSLLTALVSAVILWVGGGGLGPMFAFGSTAVTLSKFNPATHIIDLVRWSYFGGDAAVAATLGVLAAVCVVAIMTAVLGYARRIHREEAMA